jgi:hypothetical protein
MQSEKFMIRITTDDFEIVKMQLREQYIENRIFEDEIYLSISFLQLNQSDIDSIFNIQQIKEVRVIVFGVVPIQYNIIRKENAVEKRME